MNLKYGELRIELPNVIKFTKAMRQFDADTARIYTGYLQLNDNLYYGYFLRKRYEA